MEINIFYHDNLEALYTKVLKDANKINAVIEGDISSGSFAIKILGSNYLGRYKFNNQVITIFIDQKPFFISKNMIEQAIRTYIFNC